jgi:hypothetical protein
VEVVNRGGVLEAVPELLFHPVPGRGGRLSLAGYRCCRLMRFHESVRSGALFLGVKQAPSPRPSVGR